jgi:hypothetical protein
MKQGNDEIQGSFAALRMTTQNKQRKKRKTNNGKKQRQERKTNNGKGVKQTTARS